MAKVRRAAIALNLNKPWTTGFFDEKNRLHVTKMNPIGVIHEITPGILLELQGNPPTLIDLDGVIDIKNGCFIDIPEVHDSIPVEQEVDNLPIVNTVNYEEASEEEATVEKRTKKGKKK